MSAVATLQGYTAATLTAPLRTEFIAALAATLNVTASAITLSSVTDVAAHHRRRGRALLAAGVDVAFVIALPADAQANALATSVGALSSGVLLFALHGAGLNAVTSVAVSTPSVGVNTAAGAAGSSASQSPLIRAITAAPLNVAGQAHPPLPLVLSAVVNSSAPGAYLALQWSVDSAPAPLVLTPDMGEYSDMLTIPPDTLQPGGSYAFSLHAMDANGSSTASLTVTVADVASAAPARWAAAAALAAAACAALLV